VSGIPPHFPSIERLLGDPAIRQRFPEVSRARLLRAARAAVESARRSRDHGERDWAAEIDLHLRAEGTNAIPEVINASGVVLHTNLGRAPLAASAVEAIRRTAAGYSALEYDLDSGTRGSRGLRCRRRLAMLAGSEDALIVNNAAGGLLLALNTLAAGQPVAISRGELIEIGGSFRVPEIAERSSARLVEIGTTNRTHLSDYRDAISAGARAILIVHRSNFEQRGFVHTPAPRDIAALAAESAIPVIYDIGGGLAVNLEAWGLTGEPTLQEAARSSASVVIASGDKLLGGPQAGLLMGARKLIEDAGRNPLARALRADKLTLAALDATLELYEDESEALAAVPVLAMLTASSEQLRQRALLLAQACGEAVACELWDDWSQVGGGAFPEARLATTVVAIEPGPMGADALALRLRLAAVPVITRVKRGMVLLDPRTISDEDICRVAEQLAFVFADP
jgi:L-seryl-tRNA(Ser) seleniumtransferase